MNVIEPQLAQRLHTERLAVETPYRASSDGNPDLADAVLALDCPAQC